MVNIDDTSKQIRLNGDGEVIIFTLQNLQPDELTILLVVENLKKFPVEYQFALVPAG